MLIALRLLDPGRVRLRIAIHTIIASVAALLVSGVATRCAHLPGGMVVIATVVAVMVSRSLHATTLPHRLSALAYVPLIGVLASFVGRCMLHHTWFGAAAFVVSVGGSRYLMRFGGKVRRFGRLALTPLIAVLVTPVPPSAAKATGLLWGAVAGFIAVACVVLAQAVVPTRPTREAAAAAGDFVRAARRLRALTPGTRPHIRAARDLHRAALTVEIRLGAARLPKDADHTPLDALAAAVLTAEVRAQDGRPAAGHRPAPGDEPLPERTAPDRAASPGGEPVPAPRAASDQTAATERAVVPERATAPVPAPLARTAPTPEPAAHPPLGRSLGRRLDNSSGGSPDRSLDTALDTALNTALAVVTARAAAVRVLASGEHPHPDVPAPRRRTGGWRDLQPQTRLTGQLAAAMAAAFAVGHLLFPHRWAWTVITAFVVCSAARGRGDVVHRSGLRVAGAFTGAVTGTLVARLVAGEPAVAITVIFCYLLIGVWLREVSYAIWAFCVTSLLAVLYSLNGEHGSALLVQRPEGILLGSACGIAAAFFVLPLHTETVMRGRAAAALRVLQELLAALRDPAPQPASIRHLVRRFDRAAEELAAVAAPARVHRTLMHRRLNRRRDAASPHAADWADSLAACTHAARALAATDLAGLAASRAQLGLAARNLGQVRRRLGRVPDAERPTPARTGPAPLIRLDALLAELYDRLPTPAAAPPVPVPAVAAG